MVVSGLSGDLAAIEKLVYHPKTKNPACFAGEQGSRKIDDLCEILNYLPASLVLSSLANSAELGCVWAACSVPMTKPPSGFPTRIYIPEHRNHAVACGCIEYVLSEVIGIEGKAL
jgi:hypothetical protein